MPFAIAIPGLAVRFFLYEKAMSEGSSGRHLEVEGTQQRKKVLGKKQPSSKIRSPKKSLLKRFTFCDKLKFKWLE